MITELYHNKSKTSSYLKKNNFIYYDVMQLIAYIIISFPEIRKQPNSINLISNSF